MSGSPWSTPPSPKVPRLQGSFSILVDHPLHGILIDDVPFSFGYVSMIQIFKIASSFLCFRKKSLIERGMDNPICQLFDEFPRLMLRNWHTSDFPEKNCGWLRNPAPPLRDGWNFKHSGINHLQYHLALRISLHPTGETSLVYRESTRRCHSAFWSVWSSWSAVPSRNRRHGATAPQPLCHQVGGWKLLELHGGFHQWGYPKMDGL